MFQVAIIQQVDHGLSNTWSIKNTMNVKQMIVLDHFQLVEDSQR